MYIKKSIDVNGRTLSIETGKLAKQAHGSALVRYGDTMVLVTAVANDEMTEQRDFMPLTVEYREKMFAAGRIPGGFVKREGRPSEKEILSARLIDRPIRPLFPENFFFIISSNNQCNRCRYCLFFHRKIAVASPQHSN